MMRKCRQVFITRGLPCFPIRLRDDAQMHVVRVAAIRIHIGEYVQTVRVKVGDVGAVDSVDMILD